MQTKILKLALVELATILKFVSALAQVKTQTELGNIITQSVHCIYCNPGFYPHGWVWYAIVIPIAYFSNPTIDLLVFATIDMVILIVLGNRNAVFIAFFLSSFISFFVIPQNEPVLWLTLLGLYSPLLLFMPIIAKFPVGAPPAVWQFVFQTSLNIGTNYQWDYGVLVGFWLFILCYYYRFQMLEGYLKWMKKKPKKY